MSIFGVLRGRHDVEAATLALLNRWMPIYMAEVERLNDEKPGALPRPPSPESVYGGADFNSYSQDLCPSLIVVVHPTGETERTGSVGYSQWYEVEVGALVFSEDEDTSRWHADLYGAAIMGAVLQGNYAEDWLQDTTMVVAPDTTLPDEDERRIALSTTMFHVLAAPIVDATQGPAVPYPPDSPQYPGGPDAPWPNWPTGSDTNIKVTGAPVGD